MMSAFTFLQHWQNERGWACKCSYLGSSRVTKCRTCFSFFPLDQLDKNDHIRLGQLGQNLDNLTRHVIGNFVVWKTVKSLVNLPTFYEQLFRQYSFATQIACTKKVHNKLLYTQKLFIKCWWNWHLSKPTLNSNHLTTVTTILESGI